MTRKIFIVLFLTCAVVFTNSGYIYSQSSDPGIGKQFDTHSKNVLQEKLYVHTDRNFYLAGELVWFKIYNVDAGFHKPLDISKVVYVEVLNNQHNPLIQTKIAMKGGSGNGSFELPQNLSSGNYIFRAYTNWMKNFDSDFFFEKTITVVNTIKTEAINTVKNTDMNFDIQFFPEGGNLVNGIESTVGFRVVDEHGHGNDVTGTILHGDNDTVANFKTLKFGIGSFRFKPEANKFYRAIIKLANGKTITKDLPKAFNQGYALHLSKGENGKVYVKIKCSENSDNKKVHLFIHCRQQVIESSTITISNREGDFVIDETKLGDGVSHFTLFDNNRRAVCERLFFKRPGQRLMINTMSDQQQYESRKKINIQIEAKDENGKTPPASLSVAVYKIDSSKISFKENIQTYLWLTSDLKGNVESPFYYFDNNNAEVDEAMDNLMLTHGWSRFIWEDVLQEKTLAFSYIPEYEGHIISGLVKNKTNGLPATNVHSFLAIPDSNFQFYTGLTDENGNVNFYTKNFFGMREIFAQAGGRDRNFSIDIKSSFSEAHSSRVMPAFSLSNISGVALQSESVNTQVQNIYAADKLNRFSYSIDTSLFYQPTRTYVLDNYVRFPTMEEVLREYVSEVAVIKQNNVLRLENGRKDASGILYRYEPLVLVDGVPLFDDPNKIFGYDPLKVKELQVVNRKYFLGTSTFEGILNFRTYTGRPEGLALDSNATVLDYEGAQLQREFFSPVYETQQQVNSRLPDFRKLLCWAPSIRTDASGKTQLSFYSSDLPGKYMVVIEGLSADGKPGSHSFTFEVVNPLFVQK